MPEYVSSMAPSLLHSQCTMGRKILIPVSPPTVGILQQSRDFMDSWGRSGQTANSVSCHV